MKNFIQTLAFVLVLAFGLFIMSCQNVTLGPVAEKAVIAETRTSLYWENTSAPHPERMSWSDEMTRLIKANLKVYASAKDVTALCPNFKSLGETDQIKALGEFFVAVTYYESGFKPGSESVDVGTQADKGSWSVGLFQMSANDGVARKLGYDYEQLLMPLPNIRVGLEQFKLQILLTELYLLPNDSKYRYWSTLLVGNKHSKIAEIKARVLKYAPKCDNQLKK